jgi:hypothetical protein
LKRWENCANGKIKRELKKTANEDVNIDKDVHTEPDTLDIDALVPEF